jgi:hypothetical protein
MGEIVNPEDRHLQPVWVFEFALEHERGERIPIATASELLEYILAWVEEHNLQMGGGFRPCSPEELAGDEDHPDCDPEGDRDNSDTEGE